MKTILKITAVAKISHHSHFVPTDLTEQEVNGHVM